MHSPRRRRIAPGRVWVVWQGMRGGLSDVFCRVFDPAKNEWSPEIQVTSDPGRRLGTVRGLRRPGRRVGFLRQLARKRIQHLRHPRRRLDGEVGETKTLIDTDRYEGRVSAVGTPDGKGIWLACERGQPEVGPRHAGARPPAGAQRPQGQRARLSGTSQRARSKNCRHPIRCFEDLPGPQPLAPRGRRAATAPEAEAKAEERAKAKKRRTPRRTTDRARNEDRGRESAASHARCRRPSVDRRCATSRTTAGASPSRDSTAPRSSGRSPSRFPAAFTRRIARAVQALGQGRRLWICLAHRPAHLASCIRRAGIHLAKLATDLAVPRW